MVQSKYIKIKLPNGKTIDEHRLVMERAMGRCFDRTEIVHHKNGNAHDNRMENLEIMSLSEHSRMHMVGVKHRPFTAEALLAISFASRGGKCNWAKLTESEVGDIKRLLRDGLSARKIASRYNITHRTVWDIKKNRTWKHVS